MQKVTIRIGNIEGASCNADLTNVGQHCTMKVGIWGESRNYVMIGQFKKVDSKLDFDFVPGRLPVFDEKVFFEIVIFCKKILSGYFDGKVGNDGN